MNKFVKIGKVLVNSDAIISVKSIRGMEFWTVIVTLNNNETVQLKMASEFDCDLYINLLAEKLNFEPPPKRKTK